MKLTEKFASLPLVLKENLTSLSYHYSTVRPFTAKDFVNSVVRFAIRTTVKLIAKFRKKRNKSHRKKLIIADMHWKAGKQWSGGSLECFKIGKKLKILTKMLKNWKLKLKLKELIEKLPITCNVFDASEILKLHRKVKVIMMLSSFW